MVSIQKNRCTQPGASLLRANLQVQEIHDRIFHRSCMAKTIQERIKKCFVCRSPCTVKLERKRVPLAVHQVAPAGKVLASCRALQGPLSLMCLATSLSLLCLLKGGPATSSKLT
jgi:hypothetical protein